MDGLEEARWKWLFMKYLSVQFGIEVDILIRRMVDAKELVLEDIELSLDKSCCAQYVMPFLSLDN